MNQTKKMSRSIAAGGFLNSLLGKDRSPERDDPSLERGEPALFDWFGGLLDCRLLGLVGRGLIRECGRCRHGRLGSGPVRNRSWS